MKDLRRFGIVLLALSCIAVLLSACNFPVGSFTQFVMGNSPTPNTSLLPADHGLPDTIAGYRVLAVETSETTACIQPGIVIIVLQVDASNLDEMLSTDIDAVLQELNRLKPDRDVVWEFTLVGPDVTFEEFVAGNADVNSRFAGIGCESLGGPILVPTPS